MVESGHKNTILSTNSTGPDIGGMNPVNKMDHLDNSKTTISSPNTMDTSQNPNMVLMKNPLANQHQTKLNTVNTRKSAFLFGSQGRGPFMTQNNLRYSQQQYTAMQQPSAPNALRNNLQMKSAALNLSRLNEMSGTGLAGGGVDGAKNANAPIKSIYIDESAVVQEAEEIEVTDANQALQESGPRERLGGSVDASLLQPEEHFFNKGGDSEWGQVEARTEIVGDDVQRQGLEHLNDT